MDDRDLLANYQLLSQEKRKRLQLAASHRSAAAATLPDREAAALGEPLRRSWRGTRRARRSKARRDDDDDDDDDDGADDADAFAADPDASAAATDDDDDFERPQHCGRQPIQTPRTDARKQPGALSAARTRPALETTRAVAPQSPAAGLDDDDDLGVPLRPCKQDDKLIKRVCALGRKGRTPADIDSMLSSEGFTNSQGKPWPKKSDGCVIARILLNYEIDVTSENAKLVEFARAYKAKLPARPQADDDDVAQAGVTSTQPPESPEPSVEDLD